MRHSKKAVFATFIALTLPASIALASAGGDDGSSTASAIAPEPIAAPARLVGLQLVSETRRDQAAYHKRYLKRRHRRYLAHKRALARAAAAAVSTSSTQTTGAPSGALQAIAQCESGGNPSAVSPDGTYRGKYQFSRATWQAMGGSGDPAAAPEAVQDAMAAKLYATSGAGQWPVCGR